MPDHIAQLFAEAKSELNNNRLTVDKLDELEKLALCRSKNVRQRLLYLHASSPSVRSPVIASAIHEPVAGSVTQIDPLAPTIPYESVFAAIMDGWRVVHFPDQRAPFDDRELDIVGYEFILEKMEAYEHE